jgi:hypothetical protein
MAKTWAVYPWKFRRRGWRRSFLEDGEGGGGGGLMGTAGHVRSGRAAWASKRGLHQLMGYRVRGRE